MNTFRFAVVLLLLHLFVAVASHADRFEYVWGYTEPDGINVQDAQVDGDGNLYVLGLKEFQSTAQNYGKHTWYVRKLDPAAQFLWEKTFTLFESTPFVYEQQKGTPTFRVDAEGDVVVLMWFNREVTFDPEGDAVTMEGFQSVDGLYPPSNDSVYEPRHDYCILKLDADGACEWMSVIGTEHIVSLSLRGGPERMTVGPAGEIYFYAYLSHSYVIDLGYGPLPLRVRHSEIANDFEFPYQRTTSFLLKLGPDGIPVWHRQVQGRHAGLECDVFGISLDALGNPLLFGSYDHVVQGPVDFDPGIPFVSREYRYGADLRRTDDAFIQRLTPAGTFLDLCTISTNRVDTVFSHGLDADGIGYYIVQPGNEDALRTIEYEGIGKDFPGIEFADSGSREGSLGLLTMGPDGRHTSLRQIPTLGAHTRSLKDSPSTSEKVTVPPPAPRSAAEWQTTVNSRGDLILPFWEIYDVLQTDPSRDDGAYHVVAFDEELRERSRASFFYPKETSSRPSLVRIGSDDSIYFGAFAFYAMDIDPTDGVAMTSDAGADQLTFYVVKLEDVLEPDVLSITRLDPNPTNAPSVQFLVTIDEPVTGVDISDFALTTTGTVTGAAITGVTGADGEYTVTVSTGSGDGTIRLDLIDDDSIAGVTEPLGGPGADDYTDGEAYTMDHTAPVATFALPGSELSVINTVEVLVSFNEPVTGLDASDFAVTNGTITNITGDGTEFVITVLITNPGDMTLDLTGGGLTDTAGNGNGPMAGLTVTFLDINGDPSVPGPVGWALALLGLGALTMAVAMLIYYAKAESFSWE